MISKGKNVPIKLNQCRIHYPHGEPPRALGHRGRRQEQCRRWPTRRVLDMLMHKIVLDRLCPLPTDLIGMGCPTFFHNRQPPVEYLSPADKYHRLTRRPSKDQRGLYERALMASQWPSPPW